MTDPTPCLCCAVLPDRSVRAMLASRACRSSIMIGKALQLRTMRQVGGIEWCNRICLPALPAGALWPAALASAMLLPVVVSLSGCSCALLHLTHFLCNVILLPDTGPPSGAGGPLELPPRPAHHAAPGAAAATPAAAAALSSHLAPLRKLMKHL